MSNTRPRTIEYGRHSAASELSQKTQIPTNVFARYAIISIFYPMLSHVILCYLDTGIMTSRSNMLQD
jgi:hypothetical protein